MRIKSISAPTATPLTWTEHQLLRDFRTGDEEDQRFLAAMASKTAARALADRKMPETTVGANVIRLHAGVKL